MDFTAATFSLEWGKLCYSFILNEEKEFNVQKEVTVTNRNTSIAHTALPQLWEMSSSYVCLIEVGQKILKISRINLFFTLIFGKCTSLYTTWIGLFPLLADLFIMKDQ